MKPYLKLLKTFKLMKNKYFYLGLVLIFLFAFSLSYFDFLTLQDEKETFSDIELIEKLSTASNPAQSKKDIVFIFVGCSSCSASNLSYLPELVKKIKKELRLRAEKKDYGFVTIGVSAEENVRNGLIHLSKFGPFDEISTGNSWANIAIQKYIHENFKGVPATPQVFVIERSYKKFIESGYSSRDYESLNENMLINKVGSNKILLWWGANLPLEGL